MQIKHILHATGKNKQLEKKKPVQLMLYIQLSTMNVHALNVHISDLQPQ